MAISQKISPIYLVPGIYGEASDFAEFRSRLPDGIRTEIVELQSIKGPLAQLTDMKAIGAALARELDRRSPTGSLRLAGYSFGGTAVMQAARNLLDSGRQICFLGIIDGVIRPRPQADVQSESRTERLLRFIRNINATRYEGLLGWAYRIVRVGYRLLRALLGRFCCSDARLSCLRSLLNHLSPALAAFFRRMLLFHFRMKAMERWEPVPIPGRVFFAISAEYWSWVNRWKSLCPQAHFVQLPGEHVRVLEPPSLEILCLEFANAVQNADYSDPRPANSAGSS